jgi:hypothetical protein
MVPASSFVECVDPEGSVIPSAGFPSGKARDSDSSMSVVMRLDGTFG